MRKLCRLFLIVCFYNPLFLGSQTLNFEFKFDIDNDGYEESFLFYDHYDAEFEEYEFTKLCIKSEGLDPYCIENKDVWVKNVELYKLADKNLADRIGIMYENNQTYIWLTGFPYGCCLNKTFIGVWYNKSLKKLFDDEFDVTRLEKINGKRYISGILYLSEIYFEDKYSEFYLSNYYPSPYFEIGNEMKMDVELTIQKNNKFKTIEKDIDIFSASLVSIKLTNEKILVSKKFANALEQREFGILSLIKLNRDYFKNCNLEKLRIIRNELFAYNGYNFNAIDLKNYYEKKEWYKPTNKSAEEIFNDLTEIEKFNISLILEIEKNCW
jgi:hypothetical protein